MPPSRDVDMDHPQRSYRTLPRSHRTCFSAKHAIFILRYHILYTILLYISIETTKTEPDVKTLNVSQRDPQCLVTCIMIY